LPFESSMRFGCWGWKAGRGGTGISCQLVACAAALGGCTKIAADTRIIEKRSRRSFIAHLPDLAQPDRTRPDLTEPDLIPAHRLARFPRSFRSRLSCGWCR